MEKLMQRIAWRFDADLTQARACALHGGVPLQTRCGPIEYAAAGEGVPPLKVHGSGGGDDQGMAFAGLLARQGVRVVAVPRFGYHDTPLPADASPAAQADAYACLLDALGIRRAAVLGASAGALSTMQMAIRHPQRVAALILLVPITYRPAVAEAPMQPPSALTDHVIAHGHGPP